MLCMIAHSESTRSGHFADWFLTQMLFSQEVGVTLLPSVSIQEPYEDKGVTFSDLLIPGIGRQ